MQESKHHNLILRSIETVDDIEEVVNIWLITSIHCHDFIDPKFWENSKDDMKERYIPHSETTIALLNNKIVGFMSLVEDVLAAIFILPEHQGKGIGEILLKYAQAQKNKLMLYVYQKNIKAKNFYTQHGFEEINMHIDEQTGEVEIVMLWEQAIAITEMNIHSNKII